MTPEQKKISQEALEWVRRNRRELFQSVITRSGYDIETEEGIPAATFMAGTPGAGKTEVSKRFTELFSVRPLRIDADEFRESIPGYQGTNSDIIQSAASVAVEKVLDQAYHCGYSFILDGTFAYRNAVMNLKRAYRKGYTLQVFFVYQDPVIAWEFTKVRERKEGRRVPKEAFTKAYMEARRNVHNAKQEFGENLDVTLIIKDYASGKEVIYTDVDNIDSYLDTVYNEEELKGLLT